MRGVTYGPFAPGRDAAETVDEDLAAIAACGMNTVRTYSVPSRSFLDAAWRHGLRVMVGLAWEQHIAFLDDRRTPGRIRKQVRADVQSCAGHPAVLCYVIGNEIPTSVVRWHGARRVERFLQGLCRIVHAVDPGALVTYVNYPSTEYLQLDFVDFLCFNVYLETQEKLSAYLARLQILAGDRPLVMGEIGVDSRRHGETEQAGMLDWQVRTAFEAGCAGVCVFAWTDEWYRGGHSIDDWDFGLTDRQRRPKLALKSVSDAFSEAPFLPGFPWPSVSVIVCAYNAGKTMRECCEGLMALDYPDYEVIVVNDGSTDGTRSIAEQFDCRLISIENQGLSNARNVGLDAARGDIVAYIDSDAYPDRRWLQYLVAAFSDPACAAVGGPNLTPEDETELAHCVGGAPGGPIHILLSDSEAEHIPGCNMAFRRGILSGIGGFDPQFRIAGDDVDVCWRLRDAGWKLGFSPSALVWHHPRGSIRAYWNQQRRYGEAEAMLQRKWPAKYSRFGHPAWQGRLYCDTHRRRLSWSPWRVYHGIWGSAPFQALYAPEHGSLRMLTLMPEWYLVVFALFMLSLMGFAWRPLFLFVPALLLALAIPVADAAAGMPRMAQRSGGAPPQRWHWRLLAASLHLLQPLARLIGRLQRGAVPWGWRSMSGFTWPKAMQLTLWSEGWQDPTAWVSAVERALKAKGLTVLCGGDYDRWDLEVTGGVFGSARARFLVEEHGAGRQLLRVRAWPLRASSVAGLVLLCLAIPANLAALSGAWTAAFMLLVVAVLLAVIMAQQSAFALAAIRDALESLRGEGTTSQTVTYTTKPGREDVEARLGHGVV
ncbi:MAG: glycosyltransferase [Armatimonadia bacterium]